MQLRVMPQSRTLSKSMQNQQKSLVEKLGTEMAALLTGQNAAANLEAIELLPTAERAVAHAALLKAMLGMWIMYTCLAGISIACSFCAKGKVLEKEHTITETGIEAEELKRGSGCPGCSREAGQSTTSSSAG